MIRLVLILTCVTIAVGGCTARLQPAGPPVGTPALDTRAFIAGDGARLPLRRWAPDGPARAVILGLHGFNDYSKAFEAPARFWAEHGIATYAYDQRGFGDAPHPGVWAGTKTLTTDLHDVTGALRERHPGIPLYLVGVSMGGAVSVVALAGADPPDVDGVVLVAPAVWGRRHMSALSRGLLWMLSGVMPWLELSGKGLNVKPSDNIDMLLALSRDRKVIKYTRVDAIKGLVDLMDQAFGTVDEVDKPVLFLYGARDEIVPKDAIYDALRRLPENSRIAVYPNGYHMLLRDLQAETVWRDVIAWVENNEAALPSGAERDRRTLVASH